VYIEISTPHDEYYFTIESKRICIQSFEYTLFDSLSLVGKFPEFKQWLLWQFRRGKYTNRYYDAETCVFIE